MEDLVLKDYYHIPIKERIVGTWKLVPWTFKDAQGKDIHYFSEHAAGILMYDSHGYMNAQLTKAERPAFSSAALDGATLPEAHAAFSSYIAYYGRYYEESPGIIIHVVEGSLFPNWIGNRQVRYGQIAHDCLILHTPPIPMEGRDIVFYITWTKF
jgi:hypothetical protein